MLLQSVTSKGNLTCRNLVPAEKQFKSNEKNWQSGDERDFKSLTWMKLTVIIWPQDPVDPKSIMRISTNVKLKLSLHHELVPIGEENWFYIHIS